MVYVLGILILSAAVIYFVVAWQTVTEMAGADSANSKLGSGMEIALFSTVGAGYIGMLIWILRKRLGPLDSIRDNCNRFCSHDRNVYLVLL